MSLFLILQKEIIWLLAIIYLLSLITFDIIFSMNRQSRPMQFDIVSFQYFFHLEILFITSNSVSPRCYCSKNSVTTQHSSLLHSNDSYFVSCNDRITRKCSLTTAEYRWTYLSKYFITFDISTYILYRV